MRLTGKCLCHSISYHIMGWNILQKVLVSVDKIGNEAFPSVDMLGPSMKIIVLSQCEGTFIVT